MSKGTCDGCKSYNEDYPGRCVAEVKTMAKSDCPCKICVVKGMCGSPCESFNNIRPEPPILVNVDE